MDVTKFETKIRLGIPFKERWDRPDLTEVRLDLFRKRGKPVTWRPIIDPHLFLFYHNYSLLKDALGRLNFNTRTTSKTRKTSLRVRWYSLKKTEAFEIAKQELSSVNTEVRLYPFSFEQLLEDIDTFREIRLEEAAELGYSIHPTVGATLFVLDIDSISREEVEKAVNSGAIERLLFGGLPSRVFLMIVAKNVRTIPVELLPLIEFGFFLGDNEKYVEPFLDEETFLRRPLVYRDSRGKFYQRWRNESGDVYDRRYSLNDLGREKIAERAAGDQKFVDWIEGLDDGQ